MAVRYPKREQTKLVNRVKKLLTEGKTLNAACTQVSEREGGVPATNTIANWVRAAGLAETTPPAAEAEALAKPRRRTRAAGEASEKPAPEVEITEVTDSGETVEDPGTEPESTEPESTEPESTEPESTEPESQATTEPAAELVRVRTAETAVDSDHGIDGLLDENHRLRTALTEANREIRAMRDLLVVYASR